MNEKAPKTAFTTTRTLLLLLPTTEQKNTMKTTRTTKTCATQVLSFIILHIKKPGVEQGNGKISPLNSFSKRNKNEVICRYTIVRRLSL